MAKELRDETGRRVHPYIPELCEELRRGRVERREFLRLATLLGLSATAAYGLAGRIAGGSAIGQAVAQEAPKQGGTLRCSMRVQRMDDRLADCRQMSRPPHA